MINLQYYLFALAALGSAAFGQTVHVVTVGLNGTLTYRPDSIRAAVGDMVQFQFATGNHTVTQSTFAKPCEPIRMNMPNVTGFHSGFQPAEASAAHGLLSTYTITINDSSPIWAYCAQGPHCQRGMVMVMNENAGSGKTLSRFRETAAGSRTVIPVSGSGTDTESAESSVEPLAGGAGSPPDGNGSIGLDGAMSIQTPRLVGLLLLVTVVACAF